MMYRLWLVNLFWNLDSSLVEYINDTHIYFCISSAGLQTQQAILTNFDINLLWQKINKYIDGTVGLTYKIWEKNNCVICKAYLAS